MKILFLSRQPCRLRLRPPLQATRLPLQRRYGAFTVIELLVVMTIILILAGLILATSSFVQKKGALSRTEAEIAAMSAALENYKADNGTYPVDTTTNTLKANSDINPNSANYKTASVYLYTQLSGNGADRQPTANAKSYFAFKPNQLSPADQTQPVLFIRDPFGNSYGYSTVKLTTPAGTDGYNPTFDLWSTAGDLSGDRNQWIKNW